MHPESWNYSIQATINVWFVLAVVVVLSVGYWIWRRRTRGAKGRSG